jgi:hypothetical protein
MEQIDICEYLDWLLSTTLKRMPSFSTARALAVARFLSRAATNSNDQKTMQTAAWDVWLLPLVTGCDGPCATKEDAVEFLNAFDWRLTPESREKIRSAVASIPTKLTPADLSVPASRAYVEYRGESKVMYFPKGWWPKKPPKDDLGFRLWLAYAELRQIGCKRPFVLLGERLHARDGGNPDWSPQKVEKRLKPFKRFSYAGWPRWKSEFWIARQAKSGDLTIPTIPERQPFEFFGK